jgi:Tfp pilus assembly protein PilO
VLDELKIRYKHSKLHVRLALCALVGLLPAVLLYMDESTIVDEEVGRAESEEKAAAAKLTQADATLKNLPKAESELAFIREQLKKAEERLPDSVVIDEVLRSLGKSAKSFGVNVVLFEPQEEVVRGDNYKYAEVPLKISVESHDYGQICEWLDDVAGSKSKVYLKSWKLGRKASVTRSTQNASVGGLGGEAIPGQVLSESQIAEREGKKARENLRLVLDANVSLFKLASANQIAQSAAGATNPAGGAPGKTASPPVSGGQQPVDPTKPAAGAEAGGAM